MEINTRTEAIEFLTGLLVETDWVEIEDFAEGEWNAFQEMSSRDRRDPEILRYAASNLEAQALASQLAKVAEGDLDGLTWELSQAKDAELVGLARLITDMVA